MNLETLTIGPKNPYAKLGPDNPYQAVLKVSWNETSMTVALSDDTCRRIIELAGHEIAVAAQVQVDEFVRTAIAVSTLPAIEGSAA